MISRRNLIATGIAAVSCAALPLNHFPSLLEEARLYLLPGLWGVFGGTDISAEIRVENSGLMVVAWKETGLPAAFFLTETSIKDGTYRASFSQMLRSLKDCVANDLLIA